MKIVIGRFMVYYYVCGVFMYIIYVAYMHVKLKQSHYRPGNAQRFLRKLRFPDFVTKAQDGSRLSALRISRFYA